MNIQTVAQNLRNTIASKEQLLADIEIPMIPSPERMALEVTAKFLAININELKLILADVEQCVAKDVEQSWRDSPDRSGGQFTQEEIDNHGRWI